MVTTTKNIAVIPNSVSATYPNGMPVAINSLNSGVPGSSFSGSDCISLDNSSYYNDNQPGNPYIQFDGYTTALPAGASVIPCETYHMKISIANVNDNTYDSGVFLKASSFNSPEFEVNENYTIPGSSQLIEGCNDLELEIKISSPAVSDVRIDLTISGTATEGVDYETSRLRFIFYKVTPTFSFLSQPLLMILLKGWKPLLLMPICLFVELHSVKP